MRAGERRGEGFRIFEVGVKQLTKFSAKSKAELRTKQQHGRRKKQEGVTGKRSINSAPRLRREMQNDDRPQRGGETEL